TRRLLDDGEIADVFPVTNGVKQECVLAPALFSMMFSAMQLDAFRNSEEGTHIRYRTVKEMVIGDFLFVDDCTLNAASEQDMQASMDRSYAACNNFGLTISTQKDRSLPPGKPHQKPCITAKGLTLNALDSFTYLGRNLSRHVNIDEEINCRIAKASSRLQANFWECTSISLNTKLKVYQAIVLPMLLYACKRWTIYSRHVRQLNHVHMTCLRKVLKIRWHDKIPDTRVWTGTGQHNIHTLLQKTRARWAGHVLHMDNE
uniref:Reverse transcriptase domain-containing protein n=1 Tax=Lepisosteus oculatus TaxID=7918 RepID=W5LZ84_LEPOC